MSKAIITIEVPLSFLKRVLKPQDYSNSNTIMHYIVDLSNYKGNPQEEYRVNKIDYEYDQPPIKETKADE